MSLFAYIAFLFLQPSSSILFGYCSFFPPLPSSSSVSDSSYCWCFSPGLSSLPTMSYFSINCVSHSRSESNCMLFRSDKSSYSVLTASALTEKVARPLLASCPPKTLYGPPERLCNKQKQHRYKCTLYKDFTKQNNEKEKKFLGN